MKPEAEEAEMVGQLSGRLNACADLYQLCKQRHLRYAIHYEKMMVGLFDLALWYWLLKRKVRSAI